MRSIQITSAPPSSAGARSSAPITDAVIAAVVVCGAVIEVLAGHRDTFPVLIERESIIARSASRGRQHLHGARHSGARVISIFPANTVIAAVVVRNAVLEIQAGYRDTVRVLTENEPNVTGQTLRDCQLAGCAHFEGADGDSRFTARAVVAAVVI